MLLRQFGDEAIPRPKPLLVKHDGAMPARHGCEGSRRSHEQTAIRFIELPAGGKLVASAVKIGASRQRFSSPQAPRQGLCGGVAGVDLNRDELGDELGGEIIRG